jgi:Methyltransferase domain
MRPEINKRPNLRVTPAWVLLPLLVLAGCARQEAVSTSPLPAVRLVEDNAGKAPKAKYQKDYAFTDDWFSQDVPHWEVALRPYKGKPNVRYLEVGLYEGRSALWALENILTDPTSHLTGIDPFLGDYKTRWYANVEKSGQQARITTLVGYSQVELRKLPLDSFDIIYIDGSHSADDVLEDAVLCFRLLTKGGLLIFDDYQWHDPTPANTPKPAVDAFYAVFGKHLEVLHNGYQVVFRKK